MDGAAALIGDDVSNARMELRDNPHLAMPQNIDHQFQMLRVQLSAKRTNLAVPISPVLDAEQVAEVVAAVAAAA